MISHVASSTPAAGSPPVTRTARGPADTAGVNPLNRGDRLNLTAAGPGPCLQASGVPFLPAYRYTSNNQVALFYDATEIHSQLEKLVAEARRSIKVDYFIFS